MKHVHHASGRCSIHCIMPPHMLDAIQLNGSGKQRKKAVDLLKDSDDFHQLRKSAMPTGGFKAAKVFSFGSIKGPQREVYDGERTIGLPGNKLVRTENSQPTSDQEVEEAFEGSGDTFKLYADVYGRDSLDGNGMTLISTVHHQKKYDNAFWNGQQMAYGDGDLFEPLTRSLAVIGHELSHGVVQFSGGLVYQDQSGALNEHFADVFGCLTEQYKKNQPAAEASWLIGAEIIGPSIQGDALRSMKEPGLAYDDHLLGKDPQPYHMANFVITSRDHGGVHINSGIPNHAFYLLSMMLGGNAWEKAGHIWYDALQHIANPHATFVDWADETLKQASIRFGTGSRELALTRRAWKLVGVY